MELIKDLTNNAYHATKTHLSSSQIKVALNNIHNYKYFVVDGLGKKKESDSKDFGTLTHTLVLEPHMFDKEYIVWDPRGLDFRKKESKQIREEYELEAKESGRVLVEKADVEEAEKARDSLLTHKDAKKYLEMDGLIEASLFGNYELTLPSGEIVEIPIRVRADKIILGNIILDLKTSRNPDRDGFIRDSFGFYGYHYDLSAAMYKYLFDKYFEYNHPFTFLVVGNAEPYNRAVYGMSNERMEMGQKKLKDALTAIVMAERSGIWEMQTQEELI